MKQQQVFIGKDKALNQLIEYLSSINVKRIFLVRGGNSFIVCGAADKLMPKIKALNVEIVEFYNFSINPKWEDAINARDILIEKQCDCIIAVGGGSAMDIAKLTRHFALQDGYYVPLISIPTTSGTGAEATRFAVVYKDGVKQSIEADDILPDLAVIYPPFTYLNNKYLTACTGFDALAQAIEAFWNKNATAESDKYASTAISCLFENLPRCVEHLDYEKLRDEIATGAYLAGCAINITKTTAPHAFSYAFTSKCGYPHGHAVAITFPFFAEYNTQRNTAKDVRLLNLLGVKQSTSLRTFFVDYIKQLGLDYYGTNGQDLMTLLNAVNLQRLANNPIDVDADIIGRLAEFLNHLYL